MSPRHWHRVRSVTSLGLLAVVAVGLMVAPANAASIKLRFYNVNQTTIATDSAGLPLPNNGRGRAPVPGDHLDYTALDYSGSHMHYASVYNASSHLACTFVSGTMLTCNAQFAIGGSLVLGNDVTSTLAGNGTSSIPVNAGTGKYKSTRGAIFVTPIANSVNADVTITLNT
jgi:hypothetical protein